MWLLPIKSYHMQKAQVLKCQYFLINFTYKLIRKIKRNIVFIFVVRMKELKQ
jgi:hypothetical protein